MKSLRIFKNTLYSTSSPKITTTVFRAFFSAEPEHSDATFDSSHYELPILNNNNDQKPKATWNKKYRDRTDKLVFGDEPKGRLKFKEEEEERKTKALEKALLEAALSKPEEEEEEEDEDLGVVNEEDQKSLSVGIIGAPNAGKSSLTNYMVGTKVAAVSRKTNTTTHEVVGVLTKGDTQICFFDTPGLVLNCSGFPYKDAKARVESAWSSVNLYEVLIVIFDVHRHITR